MLVTTSFGILNLYLTSVSIFKRESGKKKRVYWWTFLLLDDEINESGPIEADIPFDQIRKEPLPLPKDFEWCEINMEDDKEVRKTWFVITGQKIIGFLFCFLGQGALWTFNYELCWRWWSTIQIWLFCRVFEVVNVKKKDKEKVSLLKEVFIVVGLFYPLTGERLGSLVFV